MGVLRTDRVSGLGGANAINGSVKFATDRGAGQGTYLELHDPDDDLKFGTSDWTIEFWMYANTIDTSGQENDLASILDFGYGSSNNATGAWFAVHQEDATLWLGFNNANQVQSSNFLTANTWHHIAITRTSNTAKIYGDGTQVATVSCSQNFTDAIWRLLQIGSQAASGVERNFDGYISNLRIIKGTALYTAAFTPPTTRLEKTSDTVLLCCQSPGNAFKEETGKSIVLGTLSKTPGPTASHFAPDLGEDYGTTFADGAVFDTLSYMVPPGGTTAQSNRGRGVVLGGGRSGSPTKINTISYLEIPSTGFSNDFGDLTEACIIAGCCASSTRGVRGGGYATPVNSNVIDYVTIATTSNATNFGDLTQARHWVMGGGSQTRGIFGGGNAGASPNPNTNIIDYITIASEGDAADFGDLINSYTPTIGSGNAAASPTRLLFAGGSQDVPAPATVQNVIQYVTIASTGDATDFGDLTDNKVRFGVCSSSTRALYGGAGGSDAAKTNSITYVTIATTGNTVDFGDRTVGVNNVAATSNSLRGVFIGGLGSPTSENHIDYVTIATTGDAADFGDLINSYTPTIGSGNGAASPTRLLFAGGSQDVPSPATVQNAIQYVTIASTGDATDFGDLTDNKVRFGVCSSSTRALYGGAGGSDPAKTNSITYVTIATTGNTVDFGDRTVGVNNVAATSNSLRGVFIGGLGSPTSENHIDYVTIATTGNAADWGDSFYVLEHTSACSDSHGGIS